MDVKELTETEIISRIVNGEKSLFELLIRRNNPYLYKVGRSYGYGHEDTQDLMQEAYISAYTNLSGFQGRASFRTWIVRIMLNHCYKKREKSSQRFEISTNIHDNDTPMFAHKYIDSHQEVLQSELRRVIEYSISRIPLDYRMVFSLRELSGLNVAETAEALEISEANVKVRLNRAKTMLRKEIEKSYRKEDIYEFNLIYCDQIVTRVMQRI